MKDLWKCLTENPEDLLLERGNLNIKSKGLTLVLTLAIRRLIFTFAYYLEALKVLSPKRVKF